MSLTLADSLRRGLAAGLTAGLVAGLFALVVGEVPVREAIRLEQEAAAGGGGAADALVGRSLQQGLLPVGTAVVGAAFGGFFGLAWAAGRRLLDDVSDWTASWRLGASAWLAVAFLPALAAPANPPAVGDPATIGDRSGTYLAVVAAGLAIAGACWWLARRLRERGVETIPRQVAVGAAAIALGGVVLALAAPDTEPVALPATLLWRFRLASMATQAILWAGIAGLNGWLWARAAPVPVRDRSGAATA